MYFPFALFIPEIKALPYPFLVTVITLAPKLVAIFAELSWLKLSAIKISAVIFQSFQRFHHSFGTSLYYGFLFCQRIMAYLVLSFFTYFSRHFMFGLHQLWRMGNNKHNTRHEHNDYAFVHYLCILCKCGNVFPQNSSDRAFR